MTIQSPGATAPPNTIDAARNDARGAWTDAAVALLKKLWADGDLSAALIAGRLGVSRNAVLGKVHRLGLSNRRRTFRARPERAPRPPRLPRKPAAAQAPRGPGPSSRPVVEDVGPGLVVRLEDLPHHGCHWPIGDPLSAEFRFCGRAAPRAPYCEGHRSVAYRPGGPRPIADLVRRFAGA